MKCHKCGRKATFHITEMIDAQKVELHLCDEHANEYLHQHDIFANDSNDDSTKDLQETTDSLMLERRAPRLRSRLRRFSRKT